jgi:hypothetical protein
VIGGVVVIEHVRRVNEEPAPAPVLPAIALAHAGGASR